MLLAADTIIRLTLKRRRIHAQTMTLVLIDVVWCLPFPKIQKYEKPVQVVFAGKLSIFYDWKSGKHVSFSYAPMPAVLIYCPNKRCFDSSIDNFFENFACIINT